MYQVSRQAIFSSYAKSSLLSFNPITKSGVEQYALRLVGGVQPNEGRVQIYFEGEWGAVCSKHWNFQDGRVACRQLGFADAAKVTDDEFGSIKENERVWLDELECDGTESALHDCSSSGFYKATCHTPKPAGVLCTGENTYA